MIIDLAGSPSSAMPAGSTVLVPVGSTEQHGPHLPLGTDTMIASAVAAGLAARVEPASPDPGSLDRGPELAAVLAPALAYGSSGEHQGFAGTVSIGRDALELLLVELVRSLSTWAGRIVLVNGHGGNVPTLATAVTRLRAEGHPVSWLPCAAPGADAHAGRTETSLLLHLAPGSVDLTLAEPGNTAPLAEIMGPMMRGGVAAVSANGILGDPTGASAREGLAILEAMVDGALRRLIEDRVDDRGCLLDPLS